jgi:putative spermidine/putrescine transport system permease protein
LSVRGETPPALTLPRKGGGNLVTRSIKSPSPLAGEGRGGGPRRYIRFTPYLQAAPLVAVLAAFLIVPIATILIVSFWDYDQYQLVPGFVLSNYGDVLFSPVTVSTYLSSIKFAALTWALTLAIGFTVAYFLAFHVRSTTWQTVLFLVCTIPFWTSNIIRMISWIPFLGRNGILNSMLQALHIIKSPLEFLLFSDFAVVLAYVHLYTLFMVVPIFNSMMRIDRRLIEAAVDCGASGVQILREVVITLAKSGIAIGSIFIVTLVMGDFVTVRLMSGGQSASVGLIISNQMSLLQYPAAAANAVILLVVVLLAVGAMMRLVDIRKEL